MRLLQAHASIVGTPDPTKNNITIPYVVVPGIHVLLGQGARGARPGDGAEALREAKPINSWIAGAGVVVEGIPVVEGVT